MSLYEGKKCVYCGKTFTENDDIVVCPDCGAPHHRECYKECGKCAQQDLHGTDDEWVKKNQEKPNAIILKVCPSCGAKNNTDAKICTACGKSFQTTSQPNLSEEKSMMESSLSNPNLFATYGTMKEHEEIMGISAKEWASYVGKGSYYYLTNFKAIAAGHRFTFNFGAAVFSFLYFFYRKMFKQGFALLAMIFLTLVPSFVSMGYYSDYAFSYIATDSQSFSLDMDIASLNSLIHDIDENILNENVNKNANTFYFWAVLSEMMSYVRFGITVAAALMANKLYMSHCIEKIKYTRAALPNYFENQNYYTSLAMQGGVSIKSALGALLGIVALAITVIYAITFNYIKVYFVG